MLFIGFVLNSSRDKIAITSGGCGLAIYSSLPSHEDGQARVVAEPWALKGYRKHFQAPMSIGMVILESNGACSISWPHDVQQILERKSPKIYICL